VSIKLFAMTCGWLTGELGRLMEGGEGEAELLIPSYLIEHPRARHCSIPACTPLASTIPPRGSVRG
jgi:hypothetical protein